MSQKQSLSHEILEKESELKELSIQIRKEREEWDHARKHAEEVLNEKQNQTDEDCLVAKQKAKKELVEMVNKYSDRHCVAVRNIEQRAEQVEVLRANIEKMRVDMKNNHNQLQLDLARALAEKKRCDEDVVDLRDCLKRSKGEYAELELKFKQSQELLESERDLFSKRRKAGKDENMKALSDLRQKLYTEMNSDVVSAKRIFTQKIEALEIEKRAIAEECSRASDYLEEERERFGRENSSMLQAKRNLESNLSDSANRVSVLEEKLRNNLHEHQAVLAEERQNNIVRLESEGKEREKLTEYMKSLEKQKHGLQLEKEKLLQKENAIENDREELTKRLDTLKKSEEEIKHHFSAIEEKEVRLQDSLKKRNQELDDQKNDLANQLDLLKRSENDLKCRSDNLKKADVKMQEAETKRRDNLALTEKELNSKAAKLEANKKAMDDLLLDLSKRESDARKDTNAEQIRIARIEEILKEKEEEIKNQYDQLTDAQKKVDNHIASLKDQEVKTQSEYEVSYKELEKQRKSSLEKEQELIRANEELDQQVTYLRETEDTIEKRKADLKNKEDEIRLTLRREKENIAKMQKDVELKEKRVADERVKMSRRMQALKKAEEGLRHRASKLKQRKRNYSIRSR